MTNESRVEELVQELDTIVARDAARVHLRQYGGGPDETQIIANRSGYLRLGIEFLKAGVAVPDEKLSVPLDFEYLLTSDSDVSINWAEQRDPVETSPAPETFVQKIGSTVLALSIPVFVLLFIVGTCHGTRTVFRALAR